MSTPIKKIPLSHIEDIKGSANFPESGNNGDVLVKDNTTEEGVKWINDKTQVITDSTLQGDGGSILLGLSASKNLEIASKISTLTIDSTLKGNGKDIPLGLSEAKNVEINGKISKQGINLGDTGNIPEMKTGDISGIYRGHGASNPVYDFSPFFQMVTEDTFAQLHINYVNGEMAYRAGSATIGYSPIRVSWDSGNLTNPATQTQLATKQDKSLFSALVDKWIHFYDSVTGKMQPIIKLVTGAINQLEFDGRMKLASLILPPNNSPNVANRLWSDGTYVYYDDSLAIPSRLAVDKQIYKTISGDTTLDNSYHNCIVRITANCIITVPNALRADFNCVFEAIGIYIGTFAGGTGVNISAPFGLILRDDSMCTLYKYASNYFRLNGNLINI